MSEPIALRGRLTGKSLEKSRRTMTNDEVRGNDKPQSRMITELCGFGSAGCQPAVSGSLLDTSNHVAAHVDLRTLSLFGRLPKRTG
jgi:hypothetical protein